MSKWVRPVIITVTVLAAAGAIALVLSLQPASSPPRPSKPIQQQPTNQSAQPEKGASITVSGTMACLTAKDNAGPQQLSCAIGLQADDGKQYGLFSDDPTITGSLPTGQKVTVSGTVTQQESTYNIEGVINVDSIQKID